MKHLAIISIILIATLSTAAYTKAQDRAGEQQHDRRGPPAFSELDLDDDSTITFDEFQQHEIPHGDHETIFSAIDTDSDGLISESELSDHKPPGRDGGREHR